MIQMEQVEHMNAITHRVQLGNAGGELLDKCFAVHLGAAAHCLARHDSLAAGHFPARVRIANACHSFFVWLMMF